MKIVFLSCHSGVVFRGAETVCDALATHLSVRHEVTVFQPRRFEEERPYRIIEVPVDVGDKTAPRSLLRYIRLDRAYRRMLFFAIRSFWQCLFIKPDVIMPLNGSWITLVAKLYSVVSGAKLVISGQSAVCPDPVTVRIRPDLFVCLSTQNEACVRRMAPRQKTVLIPNGVDLKRFFPAPKTNPYGLQRPIILCAAGPSRYKNVPETIHAVARISNASLLVMGGDAETRELGQRLLGDRFRQKIAPHDQMPAIFNSADLFTLVSESSEAFGVVYLEAMACNVPVIATDDGLRRSIVGEAGSYVANPKDSAEYANALQQALEENWGGKPRRQAARFDWVEIAMQYEAGFAALLGP